MGTTPDSICKSYDLWADVMCRVT